MSEMRSAIMMFVLFTVICGGVYPALVTGVAHVIFPREAGGSLLADKQNQVIGSSLIGQPFSDARYFWPRPSSATGFAYNPMGSGGSNFGPTNPDYLKGVADRVRALREAGVAGAIPAELVQSSASGLDPHITPEAAAVQVARVAKARGMTKEQVQTLVAEHTSQRQLGFLGDPRVNVLELNLALDAAK